MKIRNLRTRMIAPVLLLIPMACMHVNGGHPSSTQQSSVQSLVHDKQLSESTVQGGITIPQDSGGEK